MFKNFNINEIDFNIYDVEYSISYHNINNNEIVSYDFLSNKNNSYSVYFMITNEKDTLLSNGDYLSKFGNINKIPTIFFSLTNRKFEDNFNDLTNKNEKLEVLGKVVFIILEYIKNHNYNIYSIGVVGDKKINFYNYYRKYFKDFDIKTGDSLYYENKCYYLIKNKNIDNIKKLKIDENNNLYF
jgi:hypothetical protein